ncbi:beta-L-arabinofuranosidase domain-containing protein [Thermogutta sp.]|uniref:beta-L-arabinofuranosidase domain-containing protein n=1 Tax=Thermogutta sp. TaxID=1962930 RepID=UPI0032203ABA
MPLVSRLLFAVPIVSAFGLALAAEPELNREIQGKVPLTAHSFPLEDVRLLPSPFLHAMRKDAEFLLSLDPNRLLHTFRINAGFPSQATPLGGWEHPDCELRGHFMGHYLSACSFMYASTGDLQFRERVRYLVQELAKCQEKLSNGYLSAFPEEFFDRVETTGRVWAPYYTLHKILAGLLDSYVYCGNQQALEVAKKLGDWVIVRNSRLTDEQMQRMLNVEHGGMNEALANLYALTGENKYLQIAERFNHLAVLKPLAEDKDVLTGLHANTQIPKFIGVARLYELTGTPWYHDAALNFWKYVVHERSYVIGGNSNNEYFTPKDRLSEALGPNTAETCNTYNMLKLTRHLLLWEMSPEYADYYERALYNHILASQNPETGMMCYYVPLQPGSRKTYSTPLDSFWCCTGTGIENHAKYGESIYFHDGRDTLYVNLFVPSELKWHQKAVTVRMETQFPDSDTVHLYVEPQSPTQVTLAVRWPGWCIQGYSILVNGSPWTLENHPGQFVRIARTWTSGDHVEIRVPMQLRVESFRDNADRFAILYGPVVLAAIVPDRFGQSFSAAHLVGGEISTASFGLLAAVAERIDLAAFKPVEGQPGCWTAPRGLFRSLSDTEELEITLEPFYKVHGSRRYVVYFDRVSPSQWDKIVSEYKQAKKKWEEIEKRTIDRVIVGDPTSEREHSLSGERTESGTFAGRRWRHAVNGGWFAYTLKVAKGDEQSLLVEYWGSDVGNRVFDIMVDGTRLATQRLANNRPGRFFIELYRLPPELVKDRETITVGFQAHPGAMAGGIFDLRVVNMSADPGRKVTAPESEP